MMLTNPAKDFFVKAVMHAKQNRMQELNELEAELIIAGEELVNMKKQGIPFQTLNSFENKIDDLKKIIRNKKKELY